MSKGFGYFLITIGILWFIVISPIDLRFMNNSYSLPIGLIILGGLTIITSYFRVKHVSGIAFLIFIVLWSKSGVGIVPTLVNPILSEDYNGSINASGTLSVSCSACSNYVGSGNGEVDINYSEGLTIKNEPGKLQIGEGSEIGGAEVRLELPNLKGLDYSIGAGSLNIISEKPLSIESINASTGAGSIIIAEVLFNNLKVSTGVGSIIVNVTEVNGIASIDLSTAIGSISLNIEENIELMVDASTAIGSIENEFGSKTSGYEEASDKIMIDLSTAIGSIKIKRI